MINRLRDPVTFRLERLLVRGMHVRLLVITAMVGGASILGGLFASAFDPSLEEPGTAIWWAFLRLTDPG